MGLTQFDENYPVVYAFPFTPGSSTDDQTVVTNVGRNFRVDSLFATSTDTVDREVILTISAPSTYDFVLGSVLVPAMAGSPGVPLFDVLDALGYTPGFFNFQDSTQIRGRTPVLVSDGTVLTVFALGGAL